MLKRILEIAFLIALMLLPEYPGPTRMELPSVPRRISMAIPVQMDNAISERLSIKRHRLLKEGL